VKSSTSGEANGVYLRYSSSYPGMDPSLTHQYLSPVSQTLRIVGMYGMPTTILLICSDHCAIWHDRSKCKWRLHEAIFGLTNTLQTCVILSQTILCEPTPRALSHSAAYWLVPGSAFFGIFISECQTSEPCFVSSALTPNRFQPSS